MIMPGSWKVFSQVLGGVRQFIVGRQLDINKPLHGGNVEYAPGMGYTENKQEALEKARELNAANHSENEEAETK